MAISKIVEDIRVNWAINDAKRDEGLTTPDDIRRFDDISYGPYGTENLTPETRFPGAVEDINRALTFIEEHGTEYFMDKDRLVLVGDSAGGQLVSHFSTILTNPEFAKLFDFRVANVKVRAVGLNCGAYDGRSMALQRKDEVFLEYIDCVEKETDEMLLERVDTFKYMNSGFPPAFIMSAECDSLRDQAKPMYEHLVHLGVPCEIKIYGSKDRPDIAHVFHIDCRLEEAKRCNDDECEFFKGALLDDFFGEE